MISYDKLKFLILMQSNLSIISNMGIAFYILFKKSFLPQGHENLFCILLKAL